MVASKVENITPIKAAEYLKRNKGNRPLSVNLVNFFARQMPDGWRLTHQGIAFDTEGNLIDGQHRLNAVIKADATVPMLVSRGLDRDGMLVMDTHKKRNDADALAVAGYSVTPRSLTILKALIRGARLNSVRLTRDELIAYLDTYGEAVGFAEKHLPHTALASSGPIAGAVARAYYHVKQPILKSFCYVLTKNQANGQADASAVLSLYRHVAEQGRGHGGKTKRSQGLYLLTESAIASYASGKAIKRLWAAPQELYPLPIDDEPSETGEAEE